MQINYPPKRFCFDDGRFSFWEKIFKREFYFIGGYSIDFDKEKDIEAEVISIKDKYNLKPRHPIKWNLKDDKVIKYYIDNDEKKIYDSLFKNSDEIRGELLDLLSREEFNITLFLSAIVCLKREDKPMKSYQRCFTNLLQRLALNAEFTDNCHCVFLDFFKEDATAMAECYSSGYHFGKDTEGNEYTAGSLLEKGFCQPLYFGKTIYNQFLQLADLVTGCAEDFLEYCIKNKDFQRVVKFFPKIMDKFCKDPGSDIPFKRGIVISPDDYYGKIEEGFDKVQDESEIEPI